MPDTETEYNGWVLPADGKTGWHTDYYAFLDDADAKVLRSGPHANRPSDPPDGAWWYSTDRDMLYQYDASASNGEGAWRVRGTAWNGYELIFDDETPLTNRYIRFEHQSGGE